MVLRRVITLVLVLGQLTVVPATADTVVLLNGERHDGSVANRDLVAADPVSCSVVSILLPGESELLRFRIEEIDHIVLEDGIASHVIDFADIRTSSVQSGNAQYESAAERSYGAVTWIVVGGLLGGTGALVRFGEEEVTRPGVIERTYTPLNYIMMGGGALLVVVGIAVEASRPRSAEKQPARVSLGPSVTPSGDALGLALRWEF